VSAAPDAMMGSMGQAIGQNSGAWRRVGSPVAIYYLSGERATTSLSELCDWMARENATMMALICLIIGAKLIGDAIIGLAS
jgi:hypothetical protein